MPNWTNGNCPPLVEVMPIMEVFATGIRRVKEGGEMVRLTFYSLQADDDGRAERIVVAKIVMGRSDYHDIVRRMIGAPLVMS